MKRIVVSFMLSLAACAPSVNSPPTRLESHPSASPAQIAGFSAANRTQPPLRSNRAMAQDFLDLTFQLETGRRLPHLTRFDGPISVRLSGANNSVVQRDLRALLARLRNEAGLDIFLTGAPEARITIEAMPRARLRQIVPSAACFVVPRVSGLNEYLAARGTPLVDWARLQTRDKATVFIPSDAPPQEIRDCLHEELAQALGPLNDLYRLPDSVFNDDNIHSTLTGFDMLMLRATYAPELRSGMNKAQVAARLPGILARLNPRGERIGGGAAALSPRPWINAIQTASSASVGAARNRSGAARALSLASGFGPNDPRLGFSYYMQGRALMTQNPAQAETAFHQADRIFASAPTMRLHRAYVAIYLGARALAAGRSAEVLERTGWAIPIARAHGNGTMLASLKLLRAEALELQGRPVEAQQARLDSQNWARYGFGSDRNIRAAMAQIAALAPRR